MIWVSTLAVTQALRVFGQSTWIAGSTTALRLGVVEVETGRFHPDATVTLDLLTPGGEARPLFSGRSAGTGTVGVNLTVPDLAPGEYRLAVAARWGEDGEERRTVPVTIAPAGTVLPAPPPRELRPDEVRRIFPLVEGQPLAFDLFPEGTALVAGVTNPVFLVVTTTDDQPVAASATVDLAPGPHPTDGSGLAVVPLAPGPGRQLRVQLAAETAGGAVGKAEALLPMPPVQVRVVAEPPVVAPGGTLRVHVGSLRRRADLHLDLWRGGQWLSTQARPVTTGEAEFLVPLPDGLVGPLLVQAYLNPSSPSRVRDHRLVHVGADPSGPAVVRALQAAGYPLPPVAAAWAAQPAAASPADGPLAVAALALAASGQFRTPPLLMDSHSASQAELEAHQGRIRGVLLALLGGGGGLALLVIFFVVGRHYHRTQRQMDEALAEGLVDEEATVGRGALIELLALMGILVLALAGLIYLLTNLRWRM